MPVTSGDNIFFPDNSSPLATASDFSTMASSVQNAFNFRERFNFTWANSSERTSQLGMVQGSTGYQVDTRSEYVYDLGAWRILLPYAEFNGPATTLTTSAYTASNPITIDTSRSTSTTFASASTNIVTVTDPGIYALSVYGICSVSTTSSFLLITINSSTSFANQILRAYFTGNDVANGSRTYMQIAAGGTFYFWWKQIDTTSRTFNFNCSIARMG